MLSGSNGSHKLDPEHDYKQLQGGVIREMLHSLSLNHDPCGMLSGRPRVMDVHFRRLRRSIVRPPSQKLWSVPWHEILHEWNAHVTMRVQEARMFVFTANPTAIWKSKTKQRMVFRMIHVKDSLLARGKVWSLDFLGQYYGHVCAYCEKARSTITYVAYKR